MVAFFFQDVPPVLSVHCLPASGWWSHILLSGMALGIFMSDTYQSPLHTEKMNTSLDIPMTGMHPVSASTLSISLCVCGIYDIVGYSSQHLPSEISKENKLSLIPQLQGKFVKPFQDLCIMYHFSFLCWTNMHSWTKVTAFFHVQ